MAGTIRPTTTINSASTRFKKNAKTYTSRIRGMVDFSRHRPRNIHATPQTAPAPHCSTAQAIQGSQYSCLDCRGSSNGKRCKDWPLMYSRYLATTGKQNLQQNLAEYPRGYWPRTKRSQANAAPSPKHSDNPSCLSDNRGVPLPPGTDVPGSSENGGSQE